jgi:rRNA-processing protein FCF1
MKKILLDTNFLLTVGEFKIDIFSELNRVCGFNYELFTLDKVADEIKNIIKKQKGKTKKNAEFALKLLKKIRKIKTKEGFTDDIIAELSKDYIVATQDNNLKKRLKGKKLIIRQKNYIILI